jgi:hypothetical protein
MIRLVLSPPPTLILRELGCAGGVSVCEPSNRAPGRAIARDLTASGHDGILRRDCDRVVDWISSVHSAILIFHTTRADHA